MTCTTCGSPAAPANGYCGTCGAPVRAQSPAPVPYQAAPQQPWGAPQQPYSEAQQAWAAPPTAPPQYAAPMPPDATAPYQQQPSAYQQQTPAYPPNQATAYGASPIPGQPPYGAPPFGPPGQPAPYQPTAYSAYADGPTRAPGNVLSIVAFVLAVIACLIVPILFGPAAILCAFLGMRRGEHLGKAALFAAIGGTLLGVALGVFVQLL